MKHFFASLMLIISLSFSVIAQTTYESPLGFSLNFGKTWKRVPKEILINKLKIVSDLLEYRNDIQYDACYQKIGNSDIDYPFILFKNLLLTTSSEIEIKEIQNYFTNQNEMEKNVQKIVNGKFEFELKVGENYYDAENKILIYTYDMKYSTVGDIVGMYAFYFGKNTSLISYCYSYKDKFKYDQKEFLEIIYSIKEKGMISTVSEYSSKNRIAVKYYNEGLLKSDSSKRKEAIELFTKAIENYPPEDSYIKAEAYYNRGFNKRQIDDKKGAISDYTEAIKIRPGYFKAYLNRGYVKLVMEDYGGAIDDFTMAIKYDNYNSEVSNVALANRGIAKLAIGQLGCPDLKKAIELGNKNVVKYYNDNCR